MKRNRLRKNKIKYALIIFVLCVFFSYFSGLVTFMRYNFFANLKFDMSAKESNIATYIVKFDSNGGTGTMEDQNIRYNVPTSLSLNAFEKQEYSFGGWNTKADGTGTNYADGQEIKNSTEEIITLYAQWAQGTALIGNTSYDTLQEAINAVPTNNTETTIRLLKDVSEVLTVEKNKNIIFDFQNYTVSNSGTNAVISNNGTITIQNGTITSSTTQGAINNNSGAMLTMNGGNIIATGTKQAIYNNGGTVEITGNAYLSAKSTSRATVQNNSASSKLYITGGTIIATNFSAVQNAGIMNIGVKNSNYNINSPYIQGKTYGIDSTTNFNFYDGIIKSVVNNAISDENKVIEKEPGYEITNSTETKDNVTYKIAFLEAADYLTVTFNANGGTVSETTRDVPTRKSTKRFTNSYKARLCIHWLVYFRKWRKKS